MGLIDDYPANVEYEYGIDDIFLAINAYVMKASFCYKPISDGELFNNIINDDQALLDKSKLPCFIVDKEDNTIQTFEIDGISGFQLIIMYQEASQFEEIDNLLDFISSNFLPEKSIVIFPLHKGGSADRQGGHWNLAALYVNQAAEAKNASLEVYEPISNAKNIENDASVINSKFFKKLKSTLITKNIQTISQLTVFTNQQSDGRLCGPIAAYNAKIFIDDQNAIEKKFENDDDIKNLRIEQIESINSEVFAERQFTNWIYQGFNSSDNDYKKAQGDKIFHEWNKLKLTDTDFSNSLTNFVQEIKSSEIDSVRAFFTENSNKFNEIMINEKSLTTIFFKDHSLQETNSDFNVIEALKILASQFDQTNKFTSQLPTIPNKPKQYKRNQGYSTTYRGDEYQKLVGMSYAIKLYTEKKPFTIYTESAEKEYDFGKFDDLIIETADLTTVIQVKYAASTDPKKRFYNIDMMGYSRETELLKNKKVALYRYYDSWFEFKDKKNIEGILYSNHQLDDELNVFYDSETKTLSKLLEVHDDSLIKKNQKKLIDNIYSHSKFLTKERIKRKKVFFCMGKKDKYSNEDFEKLISNDVLSDFIKGIQNNHIIKKGLSPENYIRMLCLMPGLSCNQDTCIVSITKENIKEKKCNSTVRNFFLKKLVSLLEKNKKTIIYNEKTLNKEFNRDSIFKEIIKDFIKVKEESDKINIFISEESFYIIQGLYNTNDIRIEYVSKTVDFDSEIESFLSEKLTNDEFTDIEHLDPSIKEFIESYKLHINQHDIPKLEAEVAQKISQFFQLSNRLHYLDFSDYFLKNFREPIGEEISYETLKSVFDRTKIEINRNYLAGFVERKIDKIIKNKSTVLKNIPSIYNRWIEEFNSAFNASSFPIIIFDSADCTEKPYVTCMWIEKLLEKKILNKDDYAFLSIRKVWETDILVFEKELKLFVINDVDLVVNDLNFQENLSRMVDVAKRYPNEKKLVLIINNEKEKHKIFSLINGIPHKIINFEPIKKEQVYQLTKMSDIDYLVIPNGYVQLEILLKNQNSSIARSLYNIEKLEDFIRSNYFMRESNFLNKKIKQDSENKDFLKQKIEIKSHIDISKFKEIFLNKKILIFSKNYNDKNKIIKYLEIDSEHTIIISNQGDINNNDLKTKNNIIVIVTDMRIFLELSSKIQNQLILKYTNHKQSVKLIKADFPVEESIFLANEKPDYFKACLKKKVRQHTMIAAHAGMGKSTMVSELAKMSSATEIKEDEYHWRVPIYLDQVTVGDNEKSLSKFIFEHLKKIYELPDFFKSIIKSDLINNNILLLLDGGDQIKEYQLTECKDIYEKLINYEQVIFFTRPGQSRLVFEPNKYIILKPFDEEQIKNYFQKAFLFNKSKNLFVSSAIKFISNEKINTLLSIPLQCSLFKEAFMPYFQIWKKNKKEDLIPFFKKKEYQLIVLFQQFLDAKIYNHFERNLKIKGDILQNLDRIRLLGNGYIDRFTSVMVNQLFSDIIKNIDVRLSYPIHLDWLDDDIQSTALIERFSLPETQQLEYIIGHRTYAEYVCAKFFVEGILNLRQILPDQKKWCKELLRVGRFINSLWQFWRFVFDWIKYHQLEGNVPEDTFKNFESYFLKYPDLVSNLQEVFFNSLDENQMNPPDSYQISNVKTDDFEDNHQNIIDENKINFQNIKGIIENFDHSPYQYHNSDICTAINNIPVSDAEASLNEQLALLQKAYAKDGQLTGSYNVHGAISKALSRLGKINHSGYKNLFLWYTSENFFGFVSSNKTFFLKISASLKEAISFLLKEKKNYFNDKKDNYEKIIDFLSKEPKIDIDWLPIISFFFDKLIDKTSSSSSSPAVDHFSFFEKPFAFDEYQDLYETLFESIKNTCDSIQDSESNDILERKFYSLNSNPVSFLMYIYIKNDGVLYKEGITDKDKDKIKNMILSIDKDSFPNVVSFFQDKEINVIDLIIARFNFINLKSLPEDEQVIDISKIVEKIDTLVTNFLSHSSKETNVQEIDMAIPVLCQARDNLTMFLSAYLIFLRHKPYWQYPKQLAKYIPLLLSHYPEEGYYPYIALHVYRVYLESFLNKKNINEYDVFFDNGYNNVYKAIDYAWKFYIKTKWEYALNIIKLYSEYLKWSLIEHSPKSELQLIVPSTAQIIKFKADNQSIFNSTVTFFRSNNKPQSESESNQTEEVQEYSASFKAQVALEAIRGDMTLAKISKKYSVRLGEVQDWKAEALSKLTSLFEIASDPESSSEANPALLEP